MVLSEPLFRTKGKVEILKMRRAPSGYPFFKYYFGGSEPVWGIRG